MTETAQWSLIIGTLLPLLIAVLQRPSFKPWMRTAVMAVVCTGGALVNVDLDGSFGSARGVIAQVLLVISAAVLFHEHVWKTLGVTPAIEKATSPSAA